MVQTGEARLVVVSKVKPVKLVLQDRITFAPAAANVSCGKLTGKEMLKTVPLPPLPPSEVVPYNAFPDRTSPPNGMAPSLLVPF